MFYSLHLRPGHPVNRKSSTLPFTGLLRGEEAPSHDSNLRLSHQEVLMGWPLLLTPGYYMCLGYHWSHEFSIDIISPCIPLATDCFAKAIRGSTSPDLERAHRIFFDSPCIFVIEIHLYRLQCFQIVTCTDTF
jgi:hypothetical protein